MAQESRQASPRLLFERNLFQERYNRRAFTFRHTLTDHPLLAMPELLKLARRLPPENVRPHGGGVKIDDDFYNAHESHPLNRRLEEIVDSLEHTDSYIQISYPDSDPEFREFLEPIWEEVGQLADDLDPGRCDHMSFLFISSPGSVTPFHLDRVTNFHMQVRGEKVIQLWDPSDRRIVSEEDLDRVVAEPSTFRAPYRDIFQEHAESFHLRPGVGVHQPWGAPHALKVGSEVSISLAVTFRSTRMKRNGDLRLVNHLLRTRGLHPTPAGSSPWRDSLKLAAYRSYKKLTSIGAK